MTTSQAPEPLAGEGRGQPPAPGSAGGVGPERHDETFERWTYTYVRTTIVCLLVALGTAVVYEAWHKGMDFLPSVSAYYYTPAQGIFVGALIGLGACTIALKGTTVPEDVFLNLAGMFAAVVAIVPTSRGEDFRAAVRACDQGNSPLLTEKALSGLDCPTVQALKDATRANVENNMTALLLVGLLGLAASLFLARRLRQARPGTKAAETSRWGFVAALLIFGAAAVTFLASTGWFIDHAHKIAAISLFVCITLVALANALRREDKSLTMTSTGLNAARAVLVQKPQQINRYGWITWAMLIVSAGGVVLLLLGAISLFLLEMLVAMLFVILWSVQTVERLPGRETATDAVGQ